MSAYVRHQIGKKLLQIPVGKIFGLRELSLAGYPQAYCHIQAFVGTLIRNVMPDNPDYQWSDNAPNIYERIPQNGALPK